MGDSDVGQAGAGSLSTGDALRAQRGSESERSGCRGCGGEIDVIAKGLGRQRPEHVRPAAEPGATGGRAAAQDCSAACTRTTTTCECARALARIRCGKYRACRQVVTMRPAEGVGAFRSFCSWGLFLWTALAESTAVLDEPKGVAGEQRDRKRRDRPTAHPHRGGPGDHPPRPARHPREARLARLCRSEQR